MAAKGRERPLFSVCLCVISRSTGRTERNFLILFFLFDRTIDRIVHLPFWSDGHVPVVSRTVLNDHSNTFPCIFDRHTEQGWVLNVISILCILGPRIRIRCYFSANPVFSRVIGVFVSQSFYIGFCRFLVYRPKRMEFFGSDFFV